VIDRRALFALAALFAATAAAPAPPAVGMLTIIAGADQNPDPSGHPAPVAIRVYELAASAKFERADVFALTEREQETLGADDLGSEEFVLSPGETRTVTRELRPGVQLIGVVVLFRDIDHAQWRAVAPVGVSGPTRLILRTSGLGATLAVS
jgi:type VI secretion system protein VasD